ncbi:hypothetical protein ACFVTT_19305 [Streptomyces niveus]|uniref:hypothetical protein n=1 Tax=Streptomyces niveus TaxID=193462 RepID=UPI00343B54D6
MSILRRRTAESAPSTTTDSASLPTAPSAKEWEHQLAGLWSSVVSRAEAAVSQLTSSGS